MSKYKELMDQISVDAEMERRILSNLKAGPASVSVTKPSVKRKNLVMPFVAVACVAVLVFAVTRLYVPPAEIDPPPISVETPITSYGGFPALQAELDFDLPALQEIPEGFEATNYSIYNPNGMAEVVYTDGSGEIVYRAAMGTDDISGDYTVYETQEVMRIGDMDVTVSGKGALIYLAVWNDGTLSYSLFFSEGIEPSVCEGIIEGIVR